MGPLQDGSTRVWSNREYSPAIRQYEFPLQFVKGILSGTERRKGKGRTFRRRRFRLDRARQVVSAATILIFAHRPEKSGLILT